MPRRSRAVPALLAALLAAGPGLVGAAASAGAAADGGDPLAAQAAVRPVPVEATLPLRDVGEGPVPDGAVVAAALEEELAADTLGDLTHVAVDVRDALSGTVLFQQYQNPGFTPASLTKLLTAAAVSSTLPPREGFPTVAVRGEEPGQVVLVAGGDMLLSAGEGDPHAVVGHAGLGDLADQVAAALDDEGVLAGSSGAADDASVTTPSGAADDASVTTSPGDGQGSGPEVTLAVDLGHAPGARRPEGWTDFWMRNGYTGPIAMLGLAQDRAWPGDPAPASPEQSAARAFRVALEEAGVRVGGELDEEVPVVTAPPDAPVLGEVESAPAVDVLRTALEDSDNALVEQLARQAAVLDGAGGEPRQVTQWVLDRLTQDGLDVSGVTLADVSGLSDGTRVPARVVGDVLVAGADGSHPALQRTLARLPVAGFSGTLWNRFHLPVHDPAVGVARAKTGSLPAITSLAGYVVTGDGRLLTFVVIADRLRDANPVEARSTIDEIVAELARCGCRAR